MATNSSRSVRLKPFTLIETLLVIALIAVAFGALAFGIPRALKTERFETDVSHLLSTLVSAQEAMIDYEGDLIVHLEMSANGSSLSVTGDGVPKKCLQELNVKSALPEVRAIRFDGKEEMAVDLALSSSSATLTRGILTLIGPREASLVLPGYPARIIRGTHEKELYITQAVRPQLSSS